MVSTGYESYQMKQKEIFITNMKRVILHIPKAMFLN